MQPEPALVQRLEKSRIIWIATVRKDARPHLIPVWFIWLDGRVYLCTEPRSVKARNLASNPKAAVALEDGAHPVICEGAARFLPQPWPEPVCSEFSRKYEWNIREETQYTALVEITPEKWMSW